MAEPRGRFGPYLVLGLSAFLVTAVFAYGTANNWFSSITGEVYAVGETATEAPEPVEELPTLAPNEDGAYDEGFAEGKKSGYKRGYAKGRKDGFKHGYKIGERKGINETKGAGYDAGYPAGQKAGRKAGAKKLEQQYQAWRASK